MAAFPVPASVRRRLSGDGAAGNLAETAGTVIGRFLSLLPLVPGVAGAAMFSVAAGEFAGHVFGHGLAPWVGLGAGGMFALLLDRRL